MDLETCSALPTWTTVALAAVNMVQVVLLAFLASRRIQADNRSTRRFYQNQSQMEGVRREVRYGPSSDHSGEDLP